MAEHEFCEQCERVDDANTPRCAGLQAEVERLTALNKAENRMTSEQIERARKAEARVAGLERQVDILIRGQDNLQALYDRLKAKSGGA